MAHSGLIHRFPLNNTTEVSAPTLLGSGDSGDPDNWTGWTDNPAAGTKGVDYDYRSAGGRAILEDLGTATDSRFLLASDVLTHTDSTNTTAFMIVDDLSGESNKSFGPHVLASAYVDGSNFYSIGVGQRSGSTVWHMRDDPSQWVASTQSMALECRVWMYLVGGTVAYWFNDEIAPQHTASAEVFAATDAAVAQLRDLDSTTGDTTEISLSNIIYGHFGS